MAIKNFLELCNETAGKVHLSAGRQSFTSVLNNRGDRDDIVAHVRDAWEEIQSLYQHEGQHWRFMVHPFTINAQPGIASYPWSSIYVVDADIYNYSDEVTAVITLSDPLAGILTTSGAATYDANNGVWSVMGLVPDVNAALAAMTYEPALNYDSNFTAEVSISGDEENFTIVADNLSEIVNYTEDSTSVAIPDIEITSTFKHGQISRFRNWMVRNYDDPPKIYLTEGGSDGETYLQFLTWAEFKNIYRIGAQQAGYPAHCAIDPQNNLVLGPTPDREYTAKGYYMRSAQELVNDTDIPDMPDGFWQAIVHNAAMKYGLEKNANEVVTSGEYHYGIWMGRLEMDQLSGISIGEALA